jgi:hypothetical protein
MILWLIVMSGIASFKTRQTYPDHPLTLFSFLYRSLFRLVPYLVINSGMLPHQICSFADGLLESMHAEFERTPKKGSGSNSMTPNNSSDKLSTTTTVSFTNSVLESDGGDEPLEDYSPLIEENAVKECNQFQPSYSHSVINSHPVITPLTGGSVRYSKIHWYYYAELAYSAFLFIWIILFWQGKMYLAVAMNLYQLFAMTYLLLSYGDDREQDMYSLFYYYFCCLCCVKRPEPL